MSEAKSAQYDAGRQHLGLVYAKALLGAAEKANQVDRVLEELESVVEVVFAKLPQMFAILSAERVEFEKKEQLLDKAFKGKMSPVLLNSLKVIGKHNRLDCLKAVAIAARQLFNDARGRVAVQVRTAQPLSADLQKSISSKLKERLGKEIDLQLQVRPEILGGIVVRVGDTLFDGSLVTKLEKMRVSAIADTVATMRGAVDRFAKNN
jgi:F-type H+-transporting ATPase subunit delta